MYYTGTYQECIDYDTYVTQNENYVENDNWANPIEINGAWYIQKHENYLSEMVLVNELPIQDENLI